MIILRPLIGQPSFPTIMFTPHHASHVRCHMSRVTCHVSCVKNIFFLHFHKKRKKKKITLQKKLDQVVELVGGVSVINGAYPV